MSIEGLRTLEPRVSDWFALDADRVKAFADATDDWQFIHLDEARAASETPFGGAIAHGFLTLSMLSVMSYQVTDGVHGIVSSINYGFDRIRFVSPVRVGSRIRGRFSVAHVETGKDWADINWDVQIEVEGRDRPALVANWITRVFMTEGEI
jgi:acyl dehydratase